MSENTTTINAKVNLANEIKSKVKELNALIEKGKELSLQTFVVQNNFPDSREVIVSVSETKKY